MKLRFDGVFAAAYEVAVVIAVLAFGRPCARRGPPRRSRSAAAEREHRDHDGDLVCGCEHAVESEFNFTYQVSCTNTAIIATRLRRGRQPEPAHGERHGTTDTWFARIFGLNHQPGARQRVQPLLVDPRGHRHRDPHGIDVHPDGLFGNCIDLDNAKDSMRTMLGMLNPPASGRHGESPPVQQVQSACGRRTTHWAATATTGRLGQRGM